MQLATGPDLPGGQPGGHRRADQRGHDRGEDDAGEAARDHRGHPGGGPPGGGVRQGLADRPAPDRPPAAGRLDVAEDVGGQLARAEDRLAGERAQIGPELGLEHEQGQHLGQGGDADCADGRAGSGRGRRRGHRHRLLGGHHPADQQGQPGGGLGGPVDQPLGHLVVGQARVAGAQLLEGGGSHLGGRVVEQRPDPAPADLAQPALDDPDGVAEQAPHGRLVGGGGALGGQPLSPGLFVSVVHRSPNAFPCNRSGNHLSAPWTRSRPRLAGWAGAR